MYIRLYQRSHQVWSTAAQLDFNVSADLGVTSFTDTMLLSFTQNVGNSWDDVELSIYRNYSVFSAQNHLQEAVCY